MKKVILVFLLLLTCQLSFCQTASSVFNDFKDSKHAEYVSVPKLMLSVVAAKVKDGNAAALLKQVNEVKILTLDDCSKKVRKKFLKRISELESLGYSELVAVEKGGKLESTKILSKEKGKKIKELVVVEADNDDCNGIFIKGDINTEDVAAVIGMVDDDIDD